MDLFRIDEIVLVITQQIDHYQDLRVFRQLNRTCNIHGRKIPFTTTTTIKTPNCQITRTLLLGNVPQKIVKTVGISTFHYTYVNGKLSSSCRHDYSSSTIREYRGRTTITTYQICDDEIVEKRIGKKLRYYRRRDPEGLLYEVFYSKRSKRTKEIIYTADDKISQIIIKDGCFRLKVIDFTNGREVRLIRYHQKHPSTWTREDVTDWAFSVCLGWDDSPVDGPQLLSLTKQELQEMYEGDFFSIIWYDLQERIGRTL